MTVETVPTEKDKSARFTVERNRTSEPLRECVRHALLSYFHHLDGHSTADLYQLVLAEMEQPLLETVMRYTEGNQTRAAAILGISRSTLRKKLAIYDLQ